MKGIEIFVPKHIPNIFVILQRIYKWQCIMTELVITLKDSSYLPNIRRIVKSLVGVEKVSIPRKKRLSRYELSLLEIFNGLGRKVYLTIKSSSLFNDSRLKRLQVFTGKSFFISSRP